MSASDRDLVLGFDPGLRVTGYGIIDAAHPKPRLVEAGVIRVPTDGSLAVRLKYLYDHARELLVEYGPSGVAIEELFSHYERPKTAVLMGHARGVLVLAAAQTGVEVASYLPTQVKKAMTGSGRASKGQMQLAVQTEFALLQPPEPADVADALAVAICHYHQRRLTKG